MGSERGCQILCARLSRFVQKSLRRIGLSATLGDYSLAAEWLRAGTERPVISSDIQAGQRKLHLAVEHFTFQINLLRKQSLVRTTDTSLTTPNCVIASSLPTLPRQNQWSQGCVKLPCLRNYRIYHVHHGSISAQLREAWKCDVQLYGGGHCNTHSWIGNDIGQLERVIQLAAPLSVSSFLQVGTFGKTRRTS